MESTAIDVADPVCPSSKRAASTPTDSSLLQQYRFGCEDAATVLYLRYAKRVETLAASNASPQLQSRIDRDDIVQSVFRTFFRRAACGDYDVPEGEELWKLLLVISLNKIRAVAIHHRAHKRDVARTTHEAAPAAEMPAGDEWGYQVLRLVVEELIESLPESHKSIIQLRIDGYEVAEVAQRTHRSKRTVERVLQQFRRRLRDLIEDETPCDQRNATA